MDLRRAPLALNLVLSLPLAALACNGGEGSSESESTTATQASGFTSTASSTSTSGASDSDTTTTDGGTMSASDSSTSSDTSTSTGGETSTSTTGTSTTTGDVTASSSTTGERCDPLEDICCLEEGDIPPHALLDTFLAAYPAANMPKTVAAVQAFEPVADGHAMAWSDENVGNELVDAGNGGVIVANIEAGRAISRTAAEAALPPGSVVLNVREDPVVIEDLGTPPPCIGVGWGWGSILFEAEDTSIGELVYLYVGFCSDGDVEAFYYSDQAVEICAPTPG